MSSGSWAGSCLASCQAASNSIENSSSVIGAVFRLAFLPRHGLHNNPKLTFVKRKRLALGRPDEKPARLQLFRDVPLAIGKRMLNQQRHLGRNGLAVGRRGVGRQAEGFSGGHRSPPKTKKAM